MRIDTNQSSVPDPSLPFCYNCGARVPAQSVYCPNCLAARDGIWVCAQCGQILLPIDNYCTRCGAPKISDSGKLNRNPRAVEEVGEVLSVRIAKSMLTGLVDISEGGIATAIGSLVIGALVSYFVGFLFDEFLLNLPAFDILKLVALSSLPVLSTALEIKKLKNAAFGYIIGAIVVYWATQDWTSLAALVLVFVIVKLLGK